MNTFSSLMAEVRSIDDRLLDAVANAKSKGEILELKLRAWMRAGDVLDAALTQIAVGDPQREKVENFLRFIISLVGATLDELCDLDEQAMRAGASGVKVIDSKRLHTENELEAA